MHEVQLRVTHLVTFGTQRPTCQREMGSSQLRHAVHTLQVLKGRLALLAPSVRCGAFSYEEGEGLEEDEVRSAGSWHRWQLPHCWSVPPLTRLHLLPRCRWP